MKELSIEEKAKYYDEAIERAKSKIKNNKDHVLYEDDVIEMFPELKESEDERIRKCISDVVKEYDWSHIFGVTKDDCLAWLEKEANGNEREIPNFTWSEEEEIYVENIILAVEKQYPIAAKNIVPWLKSIKDRVQPKQEWSEEDAKALNRISTILVDASEVKNWWKEYRLIEREEMIKLTDFLKSFKDRHTWVPTDEQMERFKGIIDSLPHQEVLYSLYQDLNRLKG